MGRILFVAIALSTPALAQQESDWDSLFREGREAMRQKDYATACQRFSASAEIKRAAGVLLNLAMCEELRNHLTDSWRNWGEALTLLAQNDDRLKLAKEHMSALEKRIALLTVHLRPGSPPGTEVLEDFHQQRLRVDVATPFEPGSYRLVVSAPGRADERLSLTLSSGEQRTIELMPGDPLPGRPPTVSAPPQTFAPPPPPAPTPKMAVRAVATEKPKIGAPLGLTISGLVVGAVGAGLLGSVKSNYDSLYSQCGIAGTCTQSMVSDLIVRERAGFALVGVGAAALAGGLIWLLVERYVQYPKRVEKRL
jgi:hypothetical protein